MMEWNFLSFACEGANILQEWNGPSMVIGKRQNTFAKDRKLYFLVEKDDIFHGHQWHSYLVLSCAKYLQCDV